MELIGMKKISTTAIPKIIDSRGSLGIIESKISVPFEVRRIFYVFDLPTGSRRGAHAHKKLEQFLLCLSGSLDVRIDDGLQEPYAVHLNRPWEGIYIPPLTWVSQDNFSPGTVYIVLASEHYDENDYYRDYEEYRKAVLGLSK